MITAATAHMEWRQPFAEGFLARFTDSRAQLSAVQPLVATDGARMQRYQPGLDHRRCVEVLQPADVGGHQLRCVGGKYVHDGGDQVGADVVAAQQQIRALRWSACPVARSRRSALGGRA